MLELLRNKEQKSLTEMLLDGENNSLIKLVDENKNRITMEQVFVCEKEELIYCILVPLNDIEGVERGTAFAFCLSDDKLSLVKDQAQSAMVFDEYYEAIREINTRKGA